jgi:hypothetical protein
MDNPSNSSMSEDERKERYSINQNLLQSYRQIFISSESFLLAVGILALNEDKIVFFIIALFSIIMIIGWFDVVRSRHLIVDYYKFSVYKTGISRDDYVKKPERRNEANQIVGDDLLKGNWRPTRKKIDCMLPVMFTLVWLVLIGSYELESKKTIAGLLLDGLRMIIR